MEPVFQAIIIVVIAAAAAATVYKTCLLYTSDAADD